MDWNEALVGELLHKWDRLLVMLRGARPIVVPRWYGQITQRAQLIGFCDASAKAYAAVVYVRLETKAGVDSRFVAAKTRVAPVGGTTIPRMELLSALLLSKLVSSIEEAWQSRLQLEHPICYTDSKATLYWIQGTKHMWKQFVENRVTTIRGLVDPQHWKHCPGVENPADIPSRGMAASALAENPLWLEALFGSKPRISRLTSLLVVRLQCLNIAVQR